MSGLALSLVPRPSPRPRSGRLALVRGQGDRAGRWSTEGRRVAPAWVPGRCIRHLRSLCHISLVGALVPLGEGFSAGYADSPGVQPGGGAARDPPGGAARKALTAGSSPTGRVVQGLTPPNELVHFRVEATAGPGAHLGDHLPCAAASTRGPPVPMEVGILPPQGSLWGLLLKLPGSWQ